MLRELQRALQFRATLVFGLIHAGLVAALVGLVQAARAGVETDVLYWMIAGIVGLYGGVLAGIFSVLWPAMPWIRRARRVLQWRSWLLEDLPKLVALIPVFVQVARSARSAWDSYANKSEKSARAARDAQRDSIHELAIAVTEALEAAQTAHRAYERKPAFERKPVSEKKSAA